MLFWLWVFDCCDIESWGDEGSGDRFGGLD